MDGYRINLGGIEAVGRDLNGVSEIVGELRDLVSGIEADTGREDSTALARAAVTDAAGLLSRLRVTLDRDVDELGASVATYQKVEDLLQNLFGGDLA